MFYLKIRDEKETLFFNGEKTDKKFFEFDIDRYGENLNENNKPVILQQTPVISDDEGGELDFEEYMESFGYVLSLDTESGNTLYDDLTSTIITPRLYKDGTPVKIETFKWFVDGAFFSNELYLTVETDDIVENSNIYSLEVEIEDEDEEGENVTVTVSESIEIIYLEGVKLSEDNGRNNGDDNSRDGDADKNEDYNGDYDDPMEWGIKGFTYTRVDDYMNGELISMYKRIKEGENKKRVFGEAYARVLNRINYATLDRDLIKVEVLFSRLDNELMLKFDDIYEE